MRAVRPIQVEKAYFLRQKVLRPGLPIEQCRFELDSVAIHLGAYEGESLLGIITAHPDRNPNFPYDIQYRIRGMAVEPERQGEGIGKDLVKEMLRILRGREVPFVWCNAREIAIPFYLSLEFKILGELFDIPGVGPHQVMFRSTYVP